MRCPWARGRVFTIEKWYTTGMTVTCGYAMAGKWSLQSFTVWWKRPCVITYLQVVNRSSRRADMLWVALYPSWCPLWQCASRPLRVCIIVVRGCPSACKVWSAWASPVAKRGAFPIPALIDRVFVTFWPLNGCRRYWCLGFLHFLFSTAGRRHGIDRLTETANKP